MTIFEREMLNDLGAWYAEMVAEAIRTKPIDRKTKAQGEFSATAEASGRLSQSLRHEVTEESLKVYALAYIDKLVYGQQPSRLDNTTVFEIENWINAKGLDLSAVSVMNNLQRNGSSIWQKHQGENSGLLDGIPLEERIQEIKRSLVLKSIEEIRSDFVSQFNMAA